MQDTISDTLASKVLNPSTTTIISEHGHTVVGDCYCICHQTTTCGARFLKMVVRAWYMDESDADQRAPHECVPARPVTVEQLAALGVLSFSLDTTTYVF